jgi:hypothetical protein
MHRKHVHDSLPILWLYRANHRNGNGGSYTLGGGRGDMGLAERLHSGYPSMNLLPIRAALDRWKYQNMGISAQQYPACALKTGKASPAATATTRIVAYLSDVQELIKELFGRGLYPFQHRQRGLCGVFEICLSICRRFRFAVFNVINRLKRSNPMPGVDVVDGY